MLDPEYREDAVLAGVSGIFDGPYLPSINEYSLYFSLLQGNRTLRRVRCRLRPPPEHKHPCGFPRTFLPNPRFNLRLRYRFELLRLDELIGERASVNCRSRRSARRVTSSTMVSNGLRRLEPHQIDLLIPGGDEVSQSQRFYAGFRASRVNLYGYLYASGVRCSNIASLFFGVRRHTRPGPACRALRCSKDGHLFRPAPKAPSASRFGA